MARPAQPLRAGRQFLAFAAAAAVAVGVWWAAWSFIPAGAGSTGLQDRLLIVLKSMVMVVTFTLMLGVEAVAHERLMTPAFDPLAGRDSERLIVNNRFIRNTLEQLVPFAAGLIGLAVYCDARNGLRAIVADAGLGAGSLVFLDRLSPRPAAPCCRTSRGGAIYGPLPVVLREDWLRRCWHVWRRAAGGSVRDRRGRHYSRAASWHGAKPSI